VTSADVWPSIPIGAARATARSTCPHGTAAPTTLRSPTQGQDIKGKDMASANNSSNAKFLVSRQKFSYESHKSTRSIVFDREIGPGIFAPSERVSDDLAKEYRTIGGTLGVMVCGLWKREMTLAEIRSLEPDDPETVDREMLQIAKRHPGRIFYDVVRVGSPKPRKLNQKSRAELKRAIGKTPSDEFFLEVERLLGSLYWDQKQVSDATPSRVKARIAEVVTNIDALSDAIDNLHLTDKGLIALAATRERLKKRPTTTENELQGPLKLYRRHADEAEKRIARSIKSGGAKGRMREYAEEVFARGIARLVYKETGKRPTSTRARRRVEGPQRGSAFTQVLKFLLSLTTSKPRKDVEVLAGRALKNTCFGDV
jgi:hypothetical protein